MDIKRWFLLVLLSLLVGCSPTPVALEDAEPGATVLPSVTESQPDPQVIEPLGQSPNFGGPVYDIEVSGEHVYAGIENQLVVLDVSDPAQPQILASKLLDTDYSQPVTDIYLSGGDAYLAVSQNGLYIMDVSDPANPYVRANIRPQAQVELPSASIKRVVAVHAGYAYLSGYTCRPPCSDSDQLPMLWKVDVSQPDQPREVASMEYTSPYPVTALLPRSEFGPHLLLGDPKGSLQSMVLDGTQDIYLGQAFTTFEGLSGIVADEQQAFVASGSNRIYALDISQPDHPVELSNFVVGDPFSARNVTLSEDFLFPHTQYLPKASIGNAQQPRHHFEVIDVSDPSAPVLVASYDQPGSLYDLAVSQNIIYMAVEPGQLQTLRFDPGAITDEGRVPLQTFTPLVDQPANARQTLAGLSMQVVNVTYSSLQTLVDVQVRVDGRWGFT